MDEDEYDDTYDTSDIKLSGLYVTEGESIDTSNAEKSDPNEEYLIQLYTSKAALFHPSSRKSKDREALKQKLGWTDEMLEGWYTMLNRNVMT